MDVNQFLNNLGHFASVPNSIKALRTLVLNLAVSGD
jgi:hypothetical protein